MKEFVYVTASGSRRVDLARLRAERPDLWREHLIRTIIATQAHEGITTTYEQAAAAYDKARGATNVCSSCGRAGILDNGICQGCQYKAREPETGY